MATLSTALVTILMVSSFEMTALAEGRYEDVVCGTIDTTVAISERDIREMCELACEGRNIDPAVIEAMCYEESRFDPTAAVGKCVGLCQVSTYYHADRAKELGVEDFYDPYSSILLCADYMEELMDKYGNLELALMCYNCGEKRALELYEQGIISKYAKTIVSNAIKINGCMEQAESHEYRGTIPVVIPEEEDE